MGMIHDSRIILSYLIINIAIRFTFTIDVIAFVIIKNKNKFRKIL